MIDDERLAKMNDHLSLVLKANETTNLTRISSFEEGRLLHIEDSLSALDEVNEAPAGDLVDMGSGAGFPGIPLALASERHTTLVEARKKKAHIVQSIVSDLGLDELVSVQDTRIEEHAQEASGMYAVATARALAKLSVLLELAAPLLMKNGLLICYKAHIDDDELAHALGLLDIFGFRLKSNRQFLLSDEQTHRRIVCFEKVKNSKVSLPRHVGYAQKRPF
ncbi:MAG: 16S rRNA (guanine(527)-N(7))-methyltransferase RsmG [Eggerthellaceae bacterium]|jgi:16S rRNA (guanine527-N7)-methyltransferase